MANWVSINLSVTGSPELVKEFTASHLISIPDDEERNSWTSGYDFNFNTIIPMPILMRGTTSPTPEAEKFLQNRLTKMYGAGNWYDWALNNWDTKWGACETDNIQENDGELSLSFQTAWSYPEKIFHELAELYPSLIFYVECAEESGMFAGRIQYHGDEIIGNMSYNEDCGEMCEAINGYNPYEPD